MIRFVKCLFPLLICVAMVSCITPKLTKEEEKYIHAPLSPYSKSSTFTQALSNLGIMIETYGFPGKIILQGKNITNKTACQQNLPIDITDMLKTAVNSIGEKVQYAVYDPRFDYFYYGEKVELYGATILRRRLPQVVVEGAITECDENLDSETTGANAYGTIGGGRTETDLDAGIDKGIGYSRIALDLHLIDFKTNRLIPKKQTAMAVDVRSLEKGRSFGFHIYGSGIGIDGRRRIVQGKHNAVRSLVELSILKLIGRHLEIPYWRCIPGTGEDREVMRMMKLDFRNASGKTALIQSLLSKCGYNVKISDNADQQTLLAVRNFRMIKAGSDRIDENLYVDLMMAVPMSFLGERPFGNNYPGDMTPSEPDYSQKKKPLSLQIAFGYRSGGKGKPKDLASGSTLRSGDSYKIVFKSVQNCHIYIFQADSSGQLFQLFPMKSFKGVVVNNFNSVGTGQIFTLPAENKAFVLDNQPGAEKIYFVASRERNHELENLYRQIRTAGTRGDANIAQRNLKTHLSRKRGLKGIVTDPMPVAWNETGDIFRIMSRRLERIGKDYIYVLEFNHR